MEALNELCDLIAENPDLLSGKLAWICTSCPPSTTPRITRSHLQSLLAVARVLSRCSSASAAGARAPLLDFLRSLPSGALRHASYWPPSSPSPQSFFSDLLKYLTSAASISPDFAVDLAAFFGSVLSSAVLRSNGEDPALARAFLTAAARFYPPVSIVDSDGLVSSLLDQLGAAEADPLASSSSSDVSSWTAASASASSGCPAARPREDERDDATSRPPPSETSSNGISLRSSVDQLSPSYNGGGGGGGVAAVRPDVAVFEEESVEGLEKQEIAFRLFAHVLSNNAGNNGAIKGLHLEQIRMVATKQLKSLPAFLKVGTVAR